MRAQRVRYLVQQAPGVAVRGDQLNLAGGRHPMGARAIWNGAHDRALAAAAFARPHQGGENLQVRDRSLLAQVSEARRLLEQLLEADEACVGRAPIHWTGPAWMELIYRHCTVSDVASDGVT